MRLAAKAARLPSVARDGWRYPALRLRAKTAQTASEALRDLGLDTTHLEREFDELAPSLYAELA
jgi:predicted O-methyltransferase YrrM